MHVAEHEGPHLIVAFLIATLDIVANWQVSNNGFLSLNIHCYSGTGQR
jgi:hypothetical protein